MRPFLVALTIATLPAIAAAQSAPPAAPGQADGRGGQTITRDQFVQRAAELARKRFDTIDSGHTGTITRAQLQAFRQAHRPGGGQATGSVE